MKQKAVFGTIDFGHPEAEHDLIALRNSFYQSEGWRRVTSARRLPFLIGRKGAGKSALATRLEIEAEQTQGCYFLRIVPDEFRHVEIRSLLSLLVNTSTTWQYIYGRVWEGIIVGQIVRYLSGDAAVSLSSELTKQVEEFKTQCGFYVSAVDNALSEVLAKYVSHVKKKTDELTLIELRKTLEPYNWEPLLKVLKTELELERGLPKKLIIAIDGLDEHWDVSNPSLFFLAQLLAVTKKFTAKFDPHIQFLVCLRDNIFRALVDTKSIEYDKMESLVINLQWNPRSLFELIARRVSPKAKPDQATLDLRGLLPAEIDDFNIDEYIGSHLLNRPRDYVNFFRMLQSNSGSEPRASESHVRDALAQYCANRMIDLDNEFGLTYPGISKCIAPFADFDDIFSKNDFIDALSNLLKDKRFRSEAADLVTHYGQPVPLARILISIGVVGCYDSTAHALRFVHEFSESRVTSLWDNSEMFGVHPVYRYRTGSNRKKAASFMPSPAIVTHPADYLPIKDSIGDIDSMESKRERRRAELITELTSIEKGQQHFRRWELWVQSVMDAAFAGDLVNAETQIKATDGAKRFELIYDIMGDVAPWQEIKAKYGTHRLLVECKNTEIPTDADFSKLVRDMEALDLRVAFLAYRASGREPQGKVLDQQRSRYTNSNKERIIVAVSEGFLRQCLGKKTVIKCRNNLNSLWRDHVQRWLVS